MNSPKKILTMAALFGMVAVILGAFGAHGLKQIVKPQYVASFETGVRYQMYHALALLFVALTGITPKQKKTIAVLMLLGVVLFSGSIYILTFKEQLPEGIKFLGPVTPLGGVCLIAGWAVMAYSFYKQKEDK